MKVKKKAKKRVYIYVVLSLVTTLSLLLCLPFNSYAAVVYRPDQVISHSMNILSASSYWRGSTNAAWALGSTSVTNSSNYWFRANSSYTFPSSTTLSSVASYLDVITNEALFKSGMVYDVTLRIELTAGVQQASDFAVENLVFAPFTGTTSTDFSIMFPFGFTPVDTYYGNTRAQARYIMPVYPGSAFSADLFDQAYDGYLIDEWAIIDYDNRNFSPVSGRRYEHNYYVYVESVNTYTGEQFSQQLISGQLNDISNLIDTSTGNIIANAQQQTTRIINSINANTSVITQEIYDSSQDIIDTIKTPIPTGVPMSGVHEIVNFFDDVDDSLSNIMSTMPYVEYNIGSLGLLENVRSGVSVIRPWWQRLYEDNAFIWSLVSVSLGSLYLYQLLRLIF